MKVAALLLALLVIPALAKTKPAPQHAPLPDTILHAKTVYLLNRTGQQDVLDRAYVQFQKWGRFTVVQDKDAADLIVVFTHQSGDFRGTTVGFTEMEVFAKGESHVAYQVTKQNRVGYWTRPSPTTGDTNAVMSCVEDFEHRL